MKYKTAFIISNTNFSIENFRSELVDDLCEKFDCTYILAEHKDRFIQNYGQRNYFNLKYPKSFYSFLQLLVYMLRILYYIVRFKPNFIFCFTILPNITACYLKYFFNFNLICNVTGFGRVANRSTYLEKILYKIYLRGLNYADCVFCQNSHDYELLTNELSCNVKILPGSGINLERITYSPLRDEHQNILFLGRLIPSKGINTLLDCCLEFPNLNFTIIGFPDFADKRVLERIRSMASVKNLEFIAGTDKPLEYIRNTGFVCLPTLYREGTPRVLIEALAIGRGVITTNMPGCDDCVVDLYNGYLLDPENLHQSLHLALASISQLTKSDVEFMGVNSRKIAIKFDVQKVIEAYRQAVGVH